MIKGNFSIENPDDVQCEMRITMSLKEWRQIRASLGTKYPDWKLADMIGELIAMAEKRFIKND